MKKSLWSKEDYLNFKKEYINAKEKSLKSFTFQGNEFLVAYAKYLIEYLEPQIIEEK